MYLRQRGFRWAVMMLCLNVILLTVCVVLHIVSGQALFGWSGLWILAIAPLQLIPILFVVLFPDRRSYSLWYGALLFCFAFICLGVATTRVETDVVIGEGGILRRGLGSGVPHSTASITINPFTERAIYFPNNLELTIEGAVLRVEVDNSYGNALYEAYRGDWRAVRDSVQRNVQWLWDNWDYPDWREDSMRVVSFSHPARDQIVRSGILEMLHEKQLEEGILPYVKLTEWHPR